MPVVWTFVQARLGSDRLPRKVLADIHGESMLERVMRRAEAIGYPVALLIPETDKELAGLALAKEWVYLEGDEEDVLGRFADGVRAFKPDHVVRVTADCPFVDAGWARHTVAEHLRGGYDLTTDHLAEGRGVQVFKADALLQADKMASKYFRHSPDVWILDRNKTYSVHEMKWSVDTTNDLEAARRRCK